MASFSIDIEYINGTTYYLYQKQEINSMFNSE